MNKDILKFLRESHFANPWMVDAFVYMMVESNIKSIRKVETKNRVDVYFQYESGTEYVRSYIVDNALRIAERKIK